MVIAVPYDNMGIIPSGVKNQNTFKIYVVENGEVVRSKLAFHFGINKKTPLPEFLAEQGTEVVVCKKASGAEIKRLEEVGIKVYTGYEGSGDRCVDEYLQKAE